MRRAIEAIKPLTKTAYYGAAELRPIGRSLASEALAFGEEGSGPAVKDLDAHLVGGGVSSAVD